MKDVVDSSIQIHGYADDHAIKRSFQAGTSEEYQTISALQNCASEVKSWMDINRLKMNSSKTEFIMIGSRQQLLKCNTENINITGDIIPRKPIFKYLGALVDERMSFKDHINTKCRTAMYNLQKLKILREYLTVDACKLVAHGMVLSHLDYINSLFIGLPEVDLKKMQRVQNICAKLILRKSWRDSATACLKQLHWLPVRLRIVFKIACLVHKSLKGEAPEYLSSLLKLKTSRQGLRSSKETRLLCVPRTRRVTFAERSFSVAGPKIWNDLPDHLRKPMETDHFKSKLKTYLFDKY